MTSIIVVIFLPTSTKYSSEIHTKCLRDDIYIQRTVYRLKDQFFSVNDVYLFPLKKSALNSSLRNNLFGKQISLYSWNWIHLQQHLWVQPPRNKLSQLSCYQNVFSHTVFTSYSVIHSCELKFNITWFEICYGDSFFIILHWNSYTYKSFSLF